MWERGDRQMFGGFFLLPGETASWKWCSLSSSGKLALHVPEQEQMGEGRVTCYLSRRLKSEAAAWTSTNTFYYFTLCKIIAFKSLKSAIYCFFTECFRSSSMFTAFTGSMTWGSLWLHIPPWCLRTCTALKTTDITWESFFLTHVHIKSNQTLHHISSFHWKQQQPGAVSHCITWS